MFQEEINDAVVAEEVVEKEYVDETLVCKDCGNEFVFTAGEQRFYDEKGFLNKPKACKACRDAKKNAGKAPREYFTAVCADCGGGQYPNLRTAEAGSRHASMVEWKCSSF